MSLKELFFYELVSNKYLTINTWRILLALALIAFAFFLIRGVRRIFRRQIEKKRFDEGVALKIFQILKYGVILMTLSYVLQIMGLKVHIFKDIFEYPLIEIKDITITIYHLLLTLLIVFVTRFAIQFIKKLFDKQVKAEKIERSMGNSIFQIVRYLLWVIGIALILETIGIKITILLAGSAALLVGLGMGIQYIFNDLVSGIIMLFERNVKINDVVLLDGETGRVESIGLRTSRVITPANIEVVVPNSKFISEKVINLTHTESKAWFWINVGVAYGSELELVKNVLLQCAAQNPEVLNDIPPFVRFKNFGDSSLDFQLFFLTHNTFGVENTKSDLRFAIDKAFRENGVQIPFPQRDVHLKKN